MLGLKKKKKKRGQARHSLGLVRMGDRASGGTLSQPGETGMKETRGVCVLESKEAQTGKRHSKGFFIL